MAGRKTHEQQLRTFERKPDVPDARQMGAALDCAGDNKTARAPKRDARQSEFPVSSGGFHQESDHNKHNEPGQSGHKPEQHGPAEEKH
jgi:hypothetical protein